jgi:hypothetical protein
VGLMKKLETAQGEGIRWALGLFRNTPRNAAEHIAAIAPIQLTLEKLSQNAATRLSRLPLWSPVRVLAPATWAGSTQLAGSPTPASAVKSSLYRLAQRSSPDAESTTPFTVAPWTPRHTHQYELQVPGIGGWAQWSQIDKNMRDVVSCLTQEAIQDAHRDPHMLIVWTDGSRRLVSKTLRAGAAALLTHGNLFLDEWKWGVGRCATAYNGELAAMAAPASSHTRFSFNFSSLPLSHSLSRIIFISDSQSALRQILSCNNHPGQQFSHVFCSFTNYFLGCSAERRIGLYWIKGHSGSRWNNKVDGLAKLACTLPPTVGPTIAWRREFATKKLVSGWRRAWDFNHQPPTRLCLRSLSHPPSTRPSLIRNLEAAVKSDELPVTKLRKAVSYTIQTLLGHGWFGQHSALHRPWDPSTTTSCPCGAPGVQTREHLIFECPRHDRHRCLIREVSSSFDPHIILDTRKGQAALCKFIACDGTVFSPPSSFFDPP